jgi:alkylhydroperoxidase family enzyme
MPAEISDKECRGWLEKAIAAGKPGPEFQAIRAHSQGVMRSFTETRRWIYHNGALDFALKELVRAYIALSGDCKYCSNQGVARDINADRAQLDALLAYHKSDSYTAREKLAFRFADAIMWNPDEADDAMWAELLKEFTEEQIVELGYWIGFTFGGQRFLKTLGATQGQLQEALKRAGVNANVYSGKTSSD